jgi:hypothetical protein
MYKETEITTGTTVSYAPLFNLSFGLAVLNGYVKFEGNVYTKMSSSFKLPETTITRTLPIKAGFQDYKGRAVEGFATTTLEELGQLYNYKGDPIKLPAASISIPNWVWIVAGCVGGLILLLLLFGGGARRRPDYNYYRPPPPQYNYRGPPPPNYR